MRARTAIFVQLICAGLSICADEKLAVLEVGPTIYSNVTITAVTATDVYFKYDKGVANAKLKNLGPALQKHFHFDPARADAAKTVADAPAIAPMPEQPVSRKNAQAIMDDAIARVKAIVNQPVRQLPRTPQMEVRVFSPGWFHPGASKPDFKSVDIRRSQDTQ